MKLNLFKYITLTLFCTLTVWAYSDSDLDGVSDNKDRCPNTAFDKTVDHYGCPEKNDITLMVGQEQSSGKYGGMQKVTTDRTNFYAAFTTNNWSYSVATSDVETSTGSTTVSGSGDTFASITYTGLSTKKRLVSLQAGYKSATADTTIGTGEDDYSLRMSHILLEGRLSYSSSIGYTATGDTTTQTYEDFVSLSAGVGHQTTKNFYLSGSLNYASAYIKGTDSSLSAIAYLAYTLSDAWFITASYNHGLSDAVADATVNASLGVKF